MKPGTSVNIIPGFKELARQFLGFPVNCSEAEAELISTLSETFKQVFIKGLQAGTLGALIPSSN